MFHVALASSETLFWIGAKGRISHVKWKICPGEGEGNAFHIRMVSLNY